MTALRFGTRRSFGPCSDPKLDACLERTRPGCTDSLKRRSSHCSTKQKTARISKQREPGHKQMHLNCSHFAIDTKILMKIWYPLTDGINTVSLLTYHSTCSVQSGRCATDCRVTNPEDDTLVTENPGLWAIG
jgi:hypothetical protein